MCLYTQRYSVLCVIIIYTAANVHADIIGCARDARLATHVAYASYTAFENLVKINVIYFTPKTLI